MQTTEGRTVVADAESPAGDVQLLSHAHGDHLYEEPPKTVVTSALTTQLAGVRRDGPVPDLAESEWIDMMPAGHVPGSRAFLVDGETQFLYTGDCSIRDRFGMSGFEPVAADVLVIESTYGKPAYTIPDQDETEAEIVDWLEDTRDQPVVLLGYALGRAQELIELADRANRERIRYTPSIGALNEPIAQVRGQAFPGQVKSNFRPEAGDVLILPAQTGSLSFVDSLQERDGAILAGFSGWAVEERYRYARDLDVAFPLSDHCDFEELLAVVGAVDPDQVYTVHGFVDELASEIRSRLEVPAQALKPDQHHLGAF